MSKWEIVVALLATFLVFAAGIAIGAAIVILLSPKPLTPILM
jgi:hypothetical protein